jgi:hypothetical protein
LAAETGLDMSRFPSAGHLALWAAPVLRTTLASPSQHQARQACFAHSWLAAHQDYATVCRFEVVEQWEQPSDLRVPPREVLGMSNERVHGPPKDAAALSWLQVSRLGIAIARPDTASYPR